MRTISLHHFTTAEVLSIPNALSQRTTGYPEVSPLALHAARIAARLSSACRVPGLPNQNSRPSTRSRKRPLPRCNCGSGNALLDRLPIVVPPRSNDLSGTVWKVYPIKSDNHDPSRHDRDGRPVQVCTLFVESFYDSGNSRGNMIRTCDLLVPNPSVSPYTKCEYRCNTLLMQIYRTATAV